MIKKICILVLLLGIFVAVKPAQAFSISPVKALVTIDPGTTETVVVKIKNTEKKDQIFILSVFGTQQDNAGLPIFARGLEEAESWVYPENNTVKLKPGETKSVNFIIKTPDSAIAGSHYLALAVEPKLINNVGNTVNSRLVSLLTLQVAGQVNEEILVEKWNALVNFSSKKNWKFDLKIKNSGVVEVLMKGLLAVRDWKGDEIFSEPVVLGNKLLAGSYRVLSPTVILKENINLPGLYQVQIKIKYGLTNQNTSAITYVWYFPVWSRVLGGVFLIILLLFIFLKIKRKNY